MNDIIWYPLFISLLSECVKDDHLKKFAPYIEFDTPWSLASEQGNMKNNGLLETWWTIQEIIHETISIRIFKNILIIIIIRFIFDLNDNDWMSIFWMMWLIIIKRFRYLINSRDLISLIEMILGCCILILNGISFWMENFTCNTPI